MPLWVHCPQCDQHYQFPDATAGKQATCPKCGKILSVAAAPVPIPKAPRLPFPAAQSEEEPLWALSVPSGAPGQDRHPTPPPRTRSPAPPPEELAATAGDNPTAHFHAACGGATTFSSDVAARIMGDPFNFVPATFCARCRRFVGLRSVTWHGTRETLAAYRARLRRQWRPGKILMRVLGGPLIGALLAAAVGALANPNARVLGVLAGVLIGAPLGYFVTGIVFQIVWSMGRRKKGSVPAGGPSSGAAAG